MTDVSVELPPVMTWADLEQRYPWVVARVKEICATDYKLNVSPARSDAVIQRQLSAHRRACDALAAEVGRLVAHD